MNNYESQKLREIKRKYEAILSRGAKCEKCGYNKNISAQEKYIVLKNVEIVLKIILLKMKLPKSIKN